MGLGLAAIHSQQRLLGDLLLHNVIMVPTSDGTFIPKLANLGPASNIDANLDEVLLSNTMLYAPERDTRDGDRNGASNVWDMGVILYGMLTQG